EADDNDDEEENQDEGDVKEDKEQEETQKETEKQYQELVRNLHCQYQDAPAHAAIKARLHMDFTMLLLFAVTLGRGRELRTLCLLMEMPEGRVQTLARRRQCSSHLRQSPALAS
ncbi:unnamed protein product, partial [Porites evermanni]